MLWVSPPEPCPDSQWALGTSRPASQMAREDGQRQTAENVQCFPRRTCKKTCVLQHEEAGFQRGLGFIKGKGVHIRLGQK